MRNRKRLWSLVLTVVMLLGMMPKVAFIRASAAEQYPLSPADARACADLINAEYAQGRYTIRTALFDSDGVPMFWIASGNGWDDEIQAIPYDYRDRLYAIVDGEAQACTWITSIYRTGDGLVAVQERDSMVSDFVFDHAFYHLSGGKIDETPFATGQTGMLNWDSDDPTVSADDLYDQVVPGAELLWSAWSGLTDYLFLSGDWSDGADTLAALEKIITADCVARMDPAMRSAYRSIVRQKLDKFGIYIPPAEFDHDDSQQGLAGVHLIDVTNDGVEELIVYTADPDSDEVLDAEIYTFSGGTARVILREGVGVHFDVKLAADGRRYLLVGYT